MEAFGAPRDDRSAAAGRAGACGLPTGLPGAVLFLYRAGRGGVAAMAIVITVAQQKGGTGKTTLAANLAAALAPATRVALLDIDPQKSLTRWHAIRTARDG